MWSFRAYLKAKCADQGFHAQYREQCAICPMTVLLISTIRERGLSNEAVAQGGGLELERLELLERLGPNDLLRVARRYLLAERRTVVLVRADPALELPA